MPAWQLAPKTDWSSAPVVGAEEPQSSGVRDFFSALGHHAMNLPHGAAQLVENAASGVANAVAPNSKFTGKLTDMVDADNRAMTQREQDYQRSTPNSLGAYAGATAGEIAPFLVGGVAGGLQKAGDFAAGFLPKATPKLLQRTASGATQGALVGAASPVATDAPYWDQKLGQVKGGAALGGAVPVVAGAVRGSVGAVANAARPILAPKTVVAPLLQKMTGNDPALIDALRNPQQLVPGSIPTTAQIIATPAAVATEKAYSNTAGKIPLAERAAANNDARIAALQGLAKTPEDIAAALKTRSDAASAWIGPEGKLAAGAPVDAAPILQKLDDLAGSPLGIRPTIGAAAREMAATIRARATPGTDGTALVSPGDLDAVRQNVRDFLAKHAPNGVVGTQQQAAFEPVRGSIVDAVESANPGYRDYLATYAKTSQPVNTMQAAGSILDNVAGDSRSANSTGAPQVTLTRYASALKKALSSPYGVDPEAQKTLEAIQADLQRESISSGLRSSGSDTAYNLQAPGWLASQLYGPGFSGAPAAARTVGGLAGGIGGWFGGGPFAAAGGVAGGAALMNKAARFGQSRVNDVLGRALSDPEFAAQLLAEANAQKAPSLLWQQPQIAGLLGP